MWANELLCWRSVLSGCFSSDGVGAFNCRWAHEEDSEFVCVSTKGLLTLGIIQTSKLEAADIISDALQPAEAKHNRWQGHRVVSVGY